MKRLFKNRNFVLIMAGKLISLMGNSIFDVSIIWYVLSRYGRESGKMLSLIMVMVVLPTVVFGSISGSLVDRYNKKIIMILSDLISGVCVLCVFLLMLTGRLHSAELLAVTGILSITSSIVRITVNSMIPEMFTGGELYNANAANQFIERGTALLGFAVGGGLVALIGVKAAVLLNAVSFLACALCEVFLRILKAGKCEINNRNGIKNDFKEVADFLRVNEKILRFVLIFTTVNFLWDPILNITVPYVMKNQYNISAINFGFLQAALPFGFCMGAIFFSKRQNFLKSKFVLFNSILGANITFTLFSVPIIAGLNILNNKFIVYYFILMTMITGVFSAAINISASVTIQTIVPENIRGKFMGISGSISGALIPLGGIIAGSLVGRMNPGILFIFSFTAVFLVIFVVPRSSYSYENKEDCSEIKKTADVMGT